MLRALNEWISENRLTPYIVVDAGVDGVEVPSDYVSNGQIVLNISQSAVNGLLISNEAVNFSARFGGVPMQVHVPVRAVMAIYAKENGQGMVFGSEPGFPGPDGPENADGSGTDVKRAEKKPALKIVK